MSLSCSIYRSSKRQGMYLYLPSGAALDELPAALLQYVGRLEHAMDLELSAERKLAQEQQRFSARLDALPEALRPYWLLQYANPVRSRLRVLGEG